MKKTPVLPMFLLAFVSVFWALAYLLLHDVHAYISTNSLIIIRSGIAALCVFLFAFAKKGRYLFKKLQNKKSIKYGFLLGFFAAGIEMLQSYASEYTTESNCSFISSTSIVLVPILSFFVYKLPVTKRTMFSVVLVMIGVSLLTIFLPDDETSADLLKGNLVSCVCALMVALDMVCIRSLIRSADQLSLYFYQFFFGTLIGLVSGTLGIFGGFFIDESKIVFDSWEEMKILVLPVLYLSLFSTLYAYVVMDWAQLYVTPTTEAIFSAMEPIFTLFFMWLIRDQIPVSMELYGLMLTFLGIAWYLFNPQKMNNLIRNIGFFNVNKKAVYKT